jgi:hypothetical protein
MNDSSDLFGNTSFFLLKSIVDVWRNDAFCLVSKPQTLIGFMFSIHSHKLTKLFSIKFLIWMTGLVLGYCEYLIFVKIIICRLKGTTI